MSTSIGFDIFARDRASGPMDNVGDNASRLDGRMRRLQAAGMAGARGMGSLARSAGRLALATGKGLLYGLGAAAAAAYKLGEGAAEDDKATRLLALTQRNAAGATDKQNAATERWITRMGQAKGYADDLLRPALGRLVVATGSVRESQRLTALAMDISSGSGKSLETVTSALAKAQTGSLGGLSRMGIAIKNADGSTKSLSQVTSELAEKFKGAAATAADTTSGKFERMKIALSEAGEEIGYKLLPYGLRFTDWMLNKGIPGAERLGGWLKDHLGPAIGDVVGWFKNGTSSGGDLSGAMDDLGGVVDNAKRAWDGLGPLLIQAAKDYLPVMITQIKMTAKTLRAMGDAGIWLWNNALGPTLKFSTGAFATLLRGIAKTLDVLGSVPGAPGWIKDVAGKAQNASDKLMGISSAIKSIPDSKSVTVRALTSEAKSALDSIRAYKIPDKYFKVRSSTNANLGEAAANRSNGRPMVPGTSERPQRPGQLSNAGRDLLLELVGGIRKGKVGFDRVMDTVGQRVDDQVAKVKELQAARLSYVNDFRSFVPSVFAMPAAQDANGNDIAPTLDSMLAFAKANYGQAAQLNNDIQALVGRGLSVDLLEQLKDNGSTGAAQIHALAQGNSEQLAEFNRVNAESAAQLVAAGNAIATKTLDPEIAIEQQALATARALADVLAPLLKGGQDPTEFTLTLDGDVIKAAQKKKDRNRGKGGNGK